MLRKHTRRHHGNDAANVLYSTAPLNNSLAMHEFADQLGICRWWVVLIMAECVWSNVTSILQMHGKIWFWLWPAYFTDRQSSSILWRHVSVLLKMLSSASCLAGRYVVVSTFRSRLCTPLLKYSLQVIMSSVLKVVHFQLKQCYS